RCVPGLSPLPRHKLNRGGAAAGGPEAADVLARPRGRVLDGIRALDRIAQPLALDLHRPHPNVSPPDLKGPPRIVEKRRVPPVQLQRPRTHQDAAVDDNRPHAGEPVGRASAGAYAENLAPVDRVDDRRRKATL